ncbi:MAG: hypothetical protein M1817_004320 [Caeruleum heppii]|nr:MAG: hypothetical protein M1817_004320 [Caeruleum heppii]
MMLPPFKIRHLRVAQIPSASGTGPSINWTQDAVVEIAAPEYDALVSRHPEASLSYFDEDDGELITVGTSLELSQRLDEPVRSDQVTLATTSTLSETAPAPTTSSPVLNGTEATMPPDMHSFDVLRPEHGLRAWKILEGKKRAKRYRDSVRHRLEAEPAVVGPAESSGLDFYAARGGPSTCSRIAPSGPDEVGFQTGSLTEEGKKQAIEAGMQLRSSLQPSLNGTSSPSEAERQIHQQRWAAYGRTVSCDDLRKHSGLPARDTNETAAHGDTSKSLLEAYEERVKQWSSTQQEAGIITGTESGNIVDSSVPISENRNLPEPLQLVARTLSTFASEIKRVIPEGQSQLPLPQHIPQVFEKLCRKAAKDFGTRIQTFAHAASEAQRFSEQAAEHTRQLDVEAFENSIRGICNVAVNVERYGREVLSGSTSTIFPSNGETSNDGNTTNGSVKSPDLDSSGTVAELATLQRASSPRQVGLSSDLQGDLQPACEEEVSADIETQNGIGGDENNYQQTRQTDSDPITAYDFRRRQLRRRSMRNNVVGDRRVLVGGGSPIQRPYARSSEELPYEYIVPGTRPSPMATSSRRDHRRQVLATSPHFDTANHGTQSLTLAG